jgi:LAO/AO transport system kinase
MTKSRTRPGRRHDAGPLLEDFAHGKRAALARVLSLVEDERPGIMDVMRALHAKTGRAHRIGITGPPGGGKSTLTAALVQHYRAAGEQVAVLAVDPTSPYTGGALLGDRIRMNDLALDPGVFIRSMATRGSLGGLALTTKELADVLDAFGFDRILVETVGVGQSELDIAAASDTAVVILVPESGDSVQAMKAGLMEAADLFVINKADRPGAERMAREVSMMLHLRHGRALRNVPAHHGVDLRRVAESKARTAVPASEDASGASSERPGTGTETTSGAGTGGRAGTEPDTWEIPVLQTVARTGQGVVELAEAVERHRGWATQTGELVRRRTGRLEERVREQVERALRRTAWIDTGGVDLLQQALPALERGEESPYDVAARILQAVRGDGSIS